MKKNKNQNINQTMDQYEAEAIERWGERAENSIQLWKSYTGAQRDMVLRAMDENYEEIARLMREGAAMDSPEVQERIRTWHEQLYYFYEPSIEMVESLGDMYKNDPEFRKYYEKIDPDLPDFFGDSIAYYADELATRQQIDSLLQKVKLHEILYENFGLGKVDLSGGRTAINLYGPPGTGKSVTAEAIANALGKSMIRVNYAEIESKFVGETPKNIKEAFRFAKENDAILFFDEADSILGKRLSNVSQSTDHAVNVSRSVMLLELDSFRGVTLFVIQKVYQGRRF